MRLEQQCVLQALAALHHHFKVVPAKALLVGFHPDVRFHHRGAGNIFHIVVFKHITQAADGAALLRAEHVVDWDGADCLAHKLLILSGRKS